MAAISVIFPTRDRVEDCTLTVESLMDTADNADDIEILLAVDEDDFESADKLGALGGGVRVCVVPRFGYANLDVYLGALGDQLDKDSLWTVPFNDDARMVSAGWDSVVHEWDGQFKVLISKSNRAILHDGTEISHNADLCFPIIPSKWFDIVGRFSGHMCYDTWITDVSRGVGILTDEPRFKVLHYRLPEVEGRLESLKQAYVEDLTNTYYDGKQVDQRLQDMKKLIQAGVI